MSVQSVSSDPFANFIKTYPTRTQQPQAAASLPTTQTGTQPTKKNNKLLYALGALGATGAGFVAFNKVKKGKTNKATVDALVKKITDAGENVYKKLDEYKYKHVESGKEFVLNPKKARIEVGDKIIDLDVKKEADIKVFDNDIFKKIKNEETPNPKSKGNSNISKLTLDERLEKASDEYGVYDKIDDGLWENGENGNLYKVVDGKFKMNEGAIRYYDSKAGKKLAEFVSADVVDGKRQPIDEEILNDVEKTFNNKQLVETLKKLNKPVEEATEATQ